MCVLVCLDLYIYGTPTTIDIFFPLALGNKSENHHLSCVTSPSNFLFAPNCDLLQFLGIVWVFVVLNEG
jgi:hypothetical protein